MHESAVLAAGITESETYAAGDSATLAILSDSLSAFEGWDAS